MILRSRWLIKSWLIYFLSLLCSSYITYVDYILSKACSIILWKSLQNHAHNLILVTFHSYGRTLIIKLTIWELNTFGGHVFSCWAVYFKLDTTDIIVFSSLFLYTYVKRSKLLCYKKSEPVVQFLSVFLLIYIYICFPKK